jgi:hypothetical protein
VASVSDKLPNLRLTVPTGRECLVDIVEHVIERSSEFPDFGIRFVNFNAFRKSRVAHSEFQIRDSMRSLSHSLERPKCDVDRFASRNYNKCDNSNNQDQQKHTDSANDSIYRGGGKTHEDHAPVCNTDGSNSIITYPSQ